MTEPPGRPQSRLDPTPAWTVLTDAPLRGLALAREAGTILAWDEAEGIYLLDTGGAIAPSPAPRAGSSPAPSATTARSSRCSAKGRGSGCSAPISR